jgi:hypothetical protein
MLRRGHWTSQASARGAFAAIVWRGNSLPHARQDRQASSVRRPLEGRQRPKKPGPSLLQVASPVWRGAPVCLRLPVFSKVVDWPLVQIPTDRHTTTGTCVLGKVLFGRIGFKSKNFFPARTNFHFLSQMNHKRRAARGRRRAQTSRRGSPRTRSTSNSPPEGRRERRPSKDRAEVALHRGSAIFAELTTHLGSILGYMQSMLSI